jgi:hypothetical protein
VHKDLHQLQREFTMRMRVPDAVPAADMASQRLQVYQKLIFNNIESFLGSSFPVLRSLYQDADWLALVRQFVQRHACRSPYFMQIASEFLAFLEQEYEPSAADPCFIGELAHYEWVELALDLSDGEVPPDNMAVTSVLDAHLVISPLAWPLVYTYPVHKINAQFRPTAPSDEPCCLLVYRNRADSVQFVEINPLTVHLLQTLEQSRDLAARNMLHRMAGELGYGTAEEFVAFGGAILDSFRAMGVVAAR